MDKESKKWWTKVELSFLEKLDTPLKIQRFLDSLPYDSEERCRSPRFVIKDRIAHCMEGALFASAVLRLHGYGCKVLDIRAVRDDDHVIALYKRGNLWGAVAKSNFSGLRFREPVYRNLRELVMSYFEFYFNIAGEKTMRSYSVPVDLRRFDKIEWMIADFDLFEIGDYLDSVRHFPVVNRAMERFLSKVDERSYRAGLLEANFDGLYKPDNDRPGLKRQGKRN